MDTVIVDTREKAQVVGRILAYFDRHGIPYRREALKTGDYCLEGRPLRVIDRKHNLQELCANVSPPDFNRFRRELQRAQEQGIRLTFLVEHNGIHKLEDVISWVNPRLKVSPLAVSGERLYRKLAALSATYGVDFQFCARNQTGKRILELLTEEEKV